MEAPKGGAPKAGGSQTQKKWGPRRVRAPKGGGFEGWRPQRVGPRRLRPKGCGGWGPKGGKPKISRSFFPSLAPNFDLFYFFLGSSRRIVVPVQGHGPLKLCVWASLGSFCQDGVEVVSLVAEIVALETRTGSNVH